MERSGAPFSQQDRQLGAIRRDPLRLHRARRLDNNVPLFPRKQTSIKWLGTPLFAKSGHYAVQQFFAASIAGIGEFSPAVGPLADLRYKAGTRGLATADMRITTLGLLRLTASRFSQFAACSGAPSHRLSSPYVP